MTSLQTYNVFSRILSEYCVRRVSVTSLVGLVYLAPSEDTKILLFELQ
jgi:hypothetical protein